MPVTSVPQVSSVPSASAALSHPPSPVLGSVGPRNRPAGFPSAVDSSAEARPGLVGTRPPPSSHPSEASLENLGTEPEDVDLERETDGTIVNAWGCQSGVPSPFSPGDAAWLDAVLITTTEDLGDRRPSPTSTPVPASSSDSSTVEAVPVELMDLECVEVDGPGKDTQSGMSATAVQGSATPAWPSESSATPAWLSAADEESGKDTHSGMSASAVQGSATPAWPSESLATLARLSAAEDSDDGFSVISEPDSPVIPEGPVPVALYHAGAVAVPTPVERAGRVLGRPLRPPPLRVTDLVTVAAVTNIQDVDRVVADLFQRHSIDHSPAVLTHIILGMIAARTHFAGRIMEQLIELQLMEITPEQLIMALFEYLTEQLNKGTVTLP